MSNSLMKMLWKFKPTFKLIRLSHKQFFLLLLYCKKYQRKLAQLSDKVLKLWNRRWALWNTSSERRKKLSLSTEKFTSKYCMQSNCIVGCSRRLKNINDLYTCIYVFPANLPVVSCIFYLWSEEEFYSAQQRFQSFKTLSLSTAFLRWYLVYREILPEKQS